MRHKKKGNALSRTTSHKKALMRNMAAQLIEHKEIKTTEAKAKELRGYIDRLITYGKKGTVHHRRLAFKFLQNKEAVNTLFEEVAAACQDRPGGYTRIIKLGLRKGDAASVVIIQLVDFAQGTEAKQATKKAEPKKKETKSEKPAKAEEEKPAKKEEAKAAEEKEVKEDEKKEEEKDKE